MTDSEFETSCRPYFLKLNKIVTHSNDFVLILCMKPSCPHLSFPHHFSISSWNARINSFSASQYMNHRLGLLEWGKTESTWYVATNWPIVRAPDGRSWVRSSRWNENWQGKPKYSEKICPNGTLSTANSTGLDLFSNPGRRGGKPATNRLNYGTAYSQA
jgi:hypothetical protein